MSPASRPGFSPIAIVWLAPVLALGMVAILAFDSSGLLLFAITPLIIIVGVVVMIRWASTAERDEPEPPEEG